MPVRRQSITRSRAKALTGEVQGLKELERKLRELQPEHPEFARKAQLVMAVAAAGVADKMRASAKAAGWQGQRTTTKSGEKVTGQDAIDSIFFYGRPGRRSPKLSALAGVAKRKSMVEWIAGRHPKSPRAKVAAGGRVAMSLAMMLEFGTTRMKARPAIRPAVTAARPGVIDDVSQGFKKILSAVANS